MAPKPTANVCKDNAKDATIKKPFNANNTDLKPLATFEESNKHSACLMRVIPNLIISKDSFIIQSLVVPTVVSVVTSVHINPQFRVTTDK
jgi:hypothetical protein